MIIYRIQDKEGRGPFKKGLADKWAGYDRTLETHPGFIAEFGRGCLNMIKHDQHSGCGFRSLEQLRAWFSRPERRRLRALGYRTVRLEVDGILGESPTQLVFVRNKPLAVDVEVVHG